MYHFGDFRGWVGIALPIPSKIIEERVFCFCDLRKLTAVFSLPFNCCNQGCSRLRHRAYIIHTSFHGMGREGQCSSYGNEYYPHISAVIIKRKDLFIKDSV